MLIYSATKKQFDADVMDGSTAQKIRDQFYRHDLYHNNNGEYKSWEESLPQMQKILNSPVFQDDIQIAIEYQIPQTAKRIDFLIAGKNDQGKENLIVVELKQWEEARKTRQSGVVNAPYRRQNSIRSPSLLSDLLL